MAAEFAPVTTTALARLPSQIADFVLAFIDSGDAPAAAISIGVHPNRAKQFARTTLADPTVREACDSAMRTRFAEAAPVAVSALVSMASNTGDKYEPAIQLAAAKDILNRSGYTAKDIRDAAADSPDLAAMSRTELLQVLEATESELANRAKVLEIAPQIDASSAQAIDLEG